MARGGINKRELDKWARGIVKESNRSLERAQQRNPPRVPVRLDAASSATSGGEGIESSGHKARLLIWLESRTGHGASIEQAKQEISDDAELLVLQLEQRGLVKVLWAANGIYAFHLSSAGRIETDRQRSLQKDRAARLRHTMDAFHRWLFDTAGDQTPINPVLFLATPAAYFAGAEITGGELHEALAHLAQHELIEEIDTEPVTVAITSQGVRCALAGGSVQDHVNQPRPGTTYNNYLPNAKGVIIGEQQNFTQNNTDGVDPTLFVQLAGYVGQVSPILGMPDEDRVELERVAQDLHTEATSGNPSRAACASSPPSSRTSSWRAPPAWRQHRASRWPSRRLPR
ncbi:hypothetical protein [Streptomyces sp. CNS654]|uniref:hypothetical protein n=1 Tax=Streptomyces sp. CNS654 TaxID=1506995 RepID=UPI000A503DFE|nr:hypothetical protein [Streptomyces sp. CNS654]